MGALSPIHLVVILVIALLILGPGKLPEVGAALGKSLREFKKATTEFQEAASITEPAVSPSSSVVPGAVAVAPVAPVAPVAHLAPLVGVTPPEGHAG